VRLFRAALEAVAPHAVLLAEANQRYENVIAHFDRGRGVHIASPFSLGPALWQAAIDGTDEASSASSGACRPSPRRTVHGGGLFPSATTRSGCPPLTRELKARRLQPGTKENRLFERLRALLAGGRDGGPLAPEG
jgi:hypothetical protein